MVLGQSNPATPGERWLSLSDTMLPTLVAHADWGTAPAKRWMTYAVRAGDRYEVASSEPVGDAHTLLQRLRSIGGEGPIVVGFDFPIGVAAHYAARAGVNDFLAWLPRLGTGGWGRFYDVAERREEIGTRRPFYPMRNGRRGETPQSHLFGALGVNSVDDLRRQCERRHQARRAASPLFWTLGAQQVGKAAISGWREVLGPELRNPSLAMAIWPFSGRMQDVLRPGSLVVVETYPAEFYHHLGVVWPPSSPGQKSGKRSQGDRAANAPSLLAWADSCGVNLRPDLRKAIRHGFGPSPSGEDPFDATVGLFGMLNILMGLRPIYEPEAEAIRKIEGWIFGQRAS